MSVRTITSREELHSLAGQEVGVSQWIEITQEMVNRFAEVTGDHQWIHIDIERSKRESPYGTTIAHGFLTLAMLSYLQSQAVNVQSGQRMAINYGMNRVRFPSPVPIPSQIRCRSKIAQLEEISSGVQITWEVTVEVQGGSKPALVAEWLTRLYY